MANLLDLIYGKNGEPIRRKANLRITTDEDGNPVIQAVDGESVTLSDDGSIDSTYVQSDGFYSCGHSTTAPIGGQCGEPFCGRISCAQCFGRCAQCAKPICLIHSQYFESRQGQRVRVCADCCDALKRRRLGRNLTRSLLSPFIEFPKTGS